MSKGTHVVIQVLAVGLAIAVASKAAIPPTYRELADATIALGQATLAILNHKVG